MVSVPSSAAVSSTEHGVSPIVTRIEPPRGIFRLRLGEVWAYRELLYFFVWRDVKIRYKQTAVRENGRSVKRASRKLHLRCIAEGF